MNPVLTPVASNVPGVEMSAVKVDSLGSHMQGYVMKPQREGKFFALHPRVTGCIPTSTASRS